MISLGENDPRVNKRKNSSTSCWSFTGWKFPLYTFMNTYIIYVKVGYLGKKADATAPIPKNQRVFPNIFPTFKANIQVILGK
jgi:hypothetical protein